MRRLFVLAVLLLPVAGEAADGVFAPQPGERVVDIIETLRGEGYEIAYSSRLVPPDLEVTVASEATAPINVLLEILEAHGLTLTADEGVFLVVRQPRGNEPAANAAGVSAPPAVIETIIVSASRYEISRDIATSQFLIDQRTIQNMPDVGEDPIRVTQRLPGVAASGASARAHFRGGEQSEVGIILNGHRLFDPFHIRDYQNVFSAIDARAIDGVEVFTGGFPVRFGDRMSGLVVMESIDAGRPRHTEIGLSVFNTSFLHAMDSGSRHWLFSARRGNLDLVIDPKFGRPSYFDVFTQYAFDVGERTSISINALYADDTVSVVLETDPEEREAALSTTRNAQLWLQADTQWTKRLKSRTALSLTDYRNRRDGASNDPQKLIADVVDIREVRRIGFRQDWTFRPHDRHLLQWGFAVGSDEARYDYRASASYFGLPALYRDQPPSVTRELAAAPDGGSYALYFADRWQLTPRVIVEWGLRWDDQTYTELASDSQLSPRASMVYSWRSGTDLRLSWGRYHQSQGIQELQVEDGITRFWPAQRADHLIVGLQQRLGEGLVLRLEAFHKDMRDVRPRFENLFDPLALFPELQADRIRLDPTSATSGGVEVSLDGERGDLSWWASYTLSEALDRINGREERRSWDQRHAVQAGVNWTNGAWNFALAAGTHTGWPTTTLALVDEGPDANGEQILVAEPGPRNSGRYGTFSSVDLRVSREFALRRGTLTAFLEVSNVLNRDNVCCTDWDIEEDGSGTTVLESSPDFWLPLLPAVGVLWEF